MRQPSVLIAALRVVIGAGFTVFDVLGPIPAGARLWVLGGVLVGLLIWAEVQRILDTRPKFAFLAPARQTFAHKNLPTTYWRVGVVNHGAPTDLVVKVETPFDSSEAVVPIHTLHQIGDNTDNGRGYRDRARAETDVNMWFDFLSVTRVDDAALARGTSFWAAAVENANSGQEEPAAIHPAGGQYMYCIRSIEYNFHAEVVDLPSRAEFTVLASGGGHVKRQRFVVLADKESGKLEVLFPPSVETRGDEITTAPPLSAPSFPEVGLRIVLAEYGAGDIWKNVTDLIAQQIVEDRVVMDVTNGTMGGDPYENVPKSLKVSFTLGPSGPVSVEVAEGGTLSIP